MAKVFVKSYRWSDNKETTYQNIGYSYIDLELDITASNAILLFLQ